MKKEEKEEENMSEERAEGRGGEEDILSPDDAL